MELSKRSLLICLVAVLCLCTLISGGNEVPMTCDPTSTLDCTLQCAPNITLNCTQFCGQQQKQCSMYCSENLACTQTCQSASDDKCTHIKCTSKNCLQMCQGSACGNVECDHKEGECMQNIMTSSGKSSGVCNSKQCTQICNLGNCDLSCGDSSTHCTQVASSESKVDCEAEECIQGCYGGGKCEMECQKKRYTKQSTICRQSASLMMGSLDEADGQTPGAGGAPSQGGSPPQGGTPPQGAAPPQGGESPQGGAPLQGGAPPQGGQTGPPTDQGQGYTGHPLEAIGKCYGEKCEQLCVMGKCDLECTGSNSCQQTIHSVSEGNKGSGKCSSTQCLQVCASSSSCSFECKDGEQCSQGAMADVDTTTLKCDSKSCNQTCNGNKCDMMCSGDDCTQQCGSQLCDQTCTAKECNLVCMRNENTTMPCNLRCEGDDVNECNMDCNGYSECSLFCGNSKVCRKYGIIYIDSGSTLPVISMAAVISAVIAHAYINKY